MDIIKRSGKLQPFDRDKIKLSLASASDEANQPLNESDLHRIVDELCRIIDGKQTITTTQIAVILSGLLYTKGFFAVLEHYLAYQRKRVPH